jgi:hypothetical protein
MPESRGSTTLNLLFTIIQNSFPAFDFTKLGMNPASYNVFGQWLTRTKVVDVLADSIKNF